MNLSGTRKSVGPLTQTPTPGSSLVRYEGEILVFDLRLGEGEGGEGVVRTNLGFTAPEVEEACPAYPENAWRDIPMIPAGKGRFVLTLPVTEAGYFEATCCVKQAGGILWVQGGNVKIHAKPAATCCSSIIYNAFLRQFGPSMLLEREASEPCAEATARLEREGHTVIPPSGTFRSFARHLDFIIGRLGCNVIQLLPVNPLPTTFGKMGRFGSPYAALSFTGVEPSLAEFDRKRTPVEQFTDLTDAIHERGAKVILDLAANHTGWAAWVHEAHPEWLLRRADGEIVSPGAWGVVWADLTELDHSSPGVADHLTEAFLTWCHRGVDGFRCDAGYMIPPRIWIQVVRTVRAAYPHTIFLLEGLGGGIDATREILGRCGFDWGYSELFQNEDKRAVENYLRELAGISREDGLLVNFAETHDNNRLAAVSSCYARHRTALCALLSCNGSFGFANGVEWLATEKIDVHGSSGLNWGSRENLVDHLARLATILKHHPCYYEGTELSVLDSASEETVVVRRDHDATDKSLWVVANTDCRAPAMASWSADTLSRGPFWDLLTGKRVVVTPRAGGVALDLAPGEVLCLTPDAGDVEAVATHGRAPSVWPEHLHRKILAAACLKVHTFYHGLTDCSDFSIDDAVGHFTRDPEGYLRRENPFSMETRTVVWRWPMDRHREVMVPPDHFLMVCCPHPFRVVREVGAETCGAETGIRLPSGEVTALFMPRRDRGETEHGRLCLTLYAPDGIHNGTGGIRYLTAREPKRLPLQFVRGDHPFPSIVIGSNGRGALVRVPVERERLTSKYDALLAANLNPACPEDRRVVWTRCRAWVTYGGFSFPLALEYLERFRTGKGMVGLWTYLVPVGNGKLVQVEMRIEGVEGENRTRLCFRRTAASFGRMLEAEEPVGLILRPDIEDRSFHHTTKAYTGPETQWPSRIVTEKRGFFFDLAGGHRFALTLSDGSYHASPKWDYMVPLPLEQERGLDATTDLFSPGYMETMLCQGDSTVVDGQVVPKAASPLYSRAGPVMDDGELELTPDALMDRSLSAYLVHREEHKSVIAGFPWFLDWGRDSLICVRGLLAAGRHGDATAVLTQFGQFEEKGTLPNMILGRNTGNRDTTDAPLWFAVAAFEAAEAVGDESFFELDMGGRPLREILLSIARHYSDGTPNGIVTDPLSGLVFSPAHFTWMDTDHPACTPRSGYCIEIQALWYRTLTGLGRMDKEGGAAWLALARNVQTSVLDLFTCNATGALSDCLHAETPVPAVQAAADDHLRPNQLLAVTLGVVEDPVRARKVVEACRELVVPGAMRSLADRHVAYPLPLTWEGLPLNDPHRPYQGVYQGDEERERKPAYHNGTAWGWLYPLFCEAWFCAFGDGGRKTALSLLHEPLHQVLSGCYGHLPEIMDGSVPHVQRGCDAQAWSVSEWLRVKTLLSSD
ncbi:amylo-alpha-1,6-glucosidase [Desulfoluna butyratoxydans]|uniref:Six-hairpin glycosidase-like n=1 Tax=Desulfoluna butyratoxydans TaxID=231438 RepID=A0A4U8YY95_9BACT|nr:amylo-alpha-1,6-glucosidase [Desulfoluna butyratoxydans]VFQ46473.1 six-hairpin glycosidase-like [Desulfoluna butyratoxydans]